MTNSIFYDQILPLVKIIKSTLKSKQENGTLTIDITLFDRWEVTSLDYNDRGLHLAISANRITKPYPLPAAIKIAEIVHKTSEYRNLIEFVKTNTHIHENPVNLVNYFIIDIIEKYFENQAAFESKIIGCIDALIADLKNKPNKTRAIVEFYGIILNEDEIELSSEIILRKPKKEDFNIDVVWTPFFHPDFPEPSAILDITLQAKDREDLTNEIKKSITTLQLFRPMMIRWHIYQINSESYNPCFQGKDPSLVKCSILKNYFLRENEVNKLKDFWKTVHPLVPEAFYSDHIKKIGYTAIAYKFYSDSLLHEGMIERKIANAVIGLESIFLKTINENKKSTQLIRRITKLFENQNFDSDKIKEIIGESYFCRSKYLHGELLSEKDKQRIALKNGGDTNNLLTTVLDYLRISTVILLHFQFEKKKEFVELIDKSITDESANQRLSASLKQVNVASMKNENNE